MDITPIGWILIPLGFLLLIARPKWLYILTILFAPFSATSILNHGSGNEASGIMPYFFFGALLLLYDAMAILSRMRIRIAKPIRKPIAYLFLFLCVCIMSLAMPLMINGKLQVMSTSNLSYQLVPVYLTHANITNTIGIIYGALLATFIARRNVDLQYFYLTLRIYLASGLFICFWGLMQFSLYSIGLPYPSSVFNNNTSGEASGFNATLELLDVKRISSVTMEPSYLAIVLVGMLPICLITVYQHTPLLGRTLDRVALIIISLTLLLTMSFNRLSWGNRHAPTLPILSEFLS